MVGPNFPRMAPFTFLLDYKYDPPCARLQRGGRETSDTQNRSAGCEDRRGYTIGASHQHHLLCHYDCVRGSSSPLGLWDCVTCIISVCSLWIKVTWAILHYFDHICITPTIDLLLLRWFVRWKYHSYKSAISGMEYSMLVARAWHATSIAPLLKGIGGVPVRCHNHANSSGVLPR
jgi:hypothetical protein